MTDKIGRLPWEDSPHIDYKAATDKALNAAQRPRCDTKSLAVRNYVASAFRKEIDILKNCPDGGGPQGGRNKQLFYSSACLFEFVSAGVLAEHEVETALREAARANGSEADHGIRQVEATIQQGRRRGLDNPRDLSHIRTSTRNGGATFIIEEAPKPVGLEGVYQLERGFWLQRESLKTIYLAALARMCPPWPVFAHCVARALTLIPPNTSLPPLVGGSGSLNWFGAVAGISGAGKSASARLAKELVKPFVRQKNLGTGEGMCDQYIRPANKETGEPAGLYEAIMFMADEADAMAALSERSGATGDSTLKSAFTGDTLGFSYRSNKGHLDEDTYRLTLIINVQPGKAGVLLDDPYGGMLQRFMWFPATDKRITRERPMMPASLELPKPGTWQYPREIRLPYEAIELIIDERERGAHGEQTPLEGHAMFIREKLAYALAFLDGRDEMTVEDWNLAGTVSRISSYTRQWVADQFKIAAEKQAAEKGRLQGVSQAASNEERTIIGNDRVNGIANWAFEKIKDAGAQGISQRDIARACSSRDRPYLQPALDMLTEGSWIERNDNNKWVRTLGKKRK